MFLQGGQEKTFKTSIFKFLEIANTFILKVMVYNYLLQKKDPNYILTYKMFKDGCDIDAFSHFFSLPVYYILYAKSCKHWILHKVRKFGLEAHLKKKTSISQ